MNGWTKHFSDGSTICGDDNDNSASWSKTKLSDMSAATVHHDGIHLCISGYGEYWQSDDFESTMFQNGPGKIVARRLCFKIGPQHRFIRPLKTEHSVMLKIIDDFSMSELMIADRIDAIPVVRIGSWLVLEYDLESKTIHWYYSGAKI